MIISARIGHQRCCESRNSSRKYLRKTEHQKRLMSFIDDEFCSGYANVISVTLLDLVLFCKRCVPRARSLRNQVNPTGAKDLETIARDQPLSSINHPQLNSFFSHLPLPTPIDQQEVVAKLQNRGSISTASLPSRPRRIICLSTPRALVDRIRIGPSGEFTSSLILTSSEADQRKSFPKRQQRPNQVLISFLPSRLPSILLAIFETST